MKVRNIDMWELVGVVDVICVTTNAIVTKEHRCVMGRGCALQAKDKFPGIDVILGIQIQAKGNIPHLIWNEQGTHIYSFPVKHHWKYPASLDLIEHSCKALVKIANENPSYRRIVLPKPGCSNGKLEWPDVRRVLRPIIGSDSRFIIVDKGEI